MSAPSWLGKVATAGIATAILAGSGVVVAIIYLTAPEPEREGAVRRTAMLVEVSSVESGRFEPQLAAMGTVRPAQDINLMPRVSGQVQQVDAGFVPGRVVDAGTTLLRIDPADALNDRILARSALAQAQADLSLELGRQSVARTEREQITGALSAEQEALILREPQLQSAQARVASAEAALRQAELTVARTTVTAPFRAMVVDRAVNVGSQVSPNTAVGRLIGVDSFWVELTLPASRLPHLPDADAVPGTAVWVQDRAAWPEDTWRRGHLDSIVRQVDDQTRMARLLVVIDDPFALDSDEPALLAGAFVNARIQARPLDDVVRIPREWLRAGDTVWEMHNEALHIRSVDVALEDAEYAYLRSGLASDALVVTSDLATVTEGAPLRTAAP